MQLMQTLISNRLDCSLARIFETGARQGVRLNIQTDRSKRIFETLPQPIQEKLVSALEQQVTLIGSLTSDSSWLEGEIAMLKQAAALYRLRIPNEFFKKIKHGDVVEIYDVEKEVQIYRNLEFLKKSSYDLLTLLVTPYSELFYREPTFNELILQRTTQILQTDSELCEWQVPEHLLVERAHNHNRMFKMKMKFASPVYSLETGTRMAIASTLQCESVGSAHQGSSVVPL